MVSRTPLAALIGGILGAGLALAAGRPKRAARNKQRAAAPDGLGLPLPKRIGAGMVLGAAAGGLAASVMHWRARLAQRERLVPPPVINATSPKVVKPTPDTLFEPRGTGLDFETRLSKLDGYLTPNDRFYLRSHSPTPRIDVATWRLAIEGSGVRTPIELSYDEISAMPQVTLTRTIECAGNGRCFFKDAFGVEAEGGQWRTGAIGTAEWTGVRLRDLLDRAGLSRDARDVMPESLDENHIRRPMPLAKALRDDTLLVLGMNGQALPPDHGFPARVLVSGWTGASSIKWVGRIQVAEEPLYSPWNTIDYVLIGPHYPPQDVALGLPVTEMPVISMLDLDWPARIGLGTKRVCGRAYAGESKVRQVACSIDDGPWRNARLLPPNIEAAWVRWELDWDAPPGQHAIRVRATDERGRTQPDTVPWNHHGYLYNAVVAHPIQVG